MLYDVVVVGGGASGMTAAVVAARSGKSVLLLERMNQLGKKLLATGNGKCNLTNLYQNLDCYRSDNVKFPLIILKQICVSETLDFFKQLGVYTKDKNGYVYPNSEQASTIVEAFQNAIQHLKITVVKDCCLEQMIVRNHHFTLHTTQGVFRAQRVILAMGGAASAKLGSDGSGFEIAKRLGHSIVKPLPALTALKSNLTYFRQLAGVRAQAKIKLYSEEQLLTEEAGEVQFTNYGISGVVVFQISRFASKRLERNEKVTAQIDLFPQWSNQDLYAKLNQIVKDCPYLTVEQCLQGLLNQKLVPALLHTAHIRRNQSIVQLQQKDWKHLIYKCKNFVVPIIGTNGLEQSQVTCGGVDTREINPYTMESKRQRGVYLTGELLDVDGTCGGYNLQWAWSTGMLAGRLKGEFR